MSIGNISSQPQFDPQLGSNAHVADVATVVLEIHKKKVKITQTKIKEVVHGLAEIAYSMGKTNDVEKFEDEMSEAVFKAFKQAEEEIEKKKKKKKKHQE